MIGPISTEENRRDDDASAADGTRPAEALYLIRCDGRHTGRRSAHAKMVAAVISYGNAGCFARYCRTPPLANSR
jgi:hypothetical protein